MIFYDYEGLTTDADKALAEQVLSSYYITDAYDITGTGIELKEDLPDLVNIHMASTKPMDKTVKVDANGNVAEDATSDEKLTKRVYVYTNMYIGQSTDDHSDGKFGQISTDAFTDFVYAGNGTSNYSLGVNGKYKTNPDNPGSKNFVIQNVENDNTTKDRLYTVTVTLKPVEEKEGSNTITLTGAKGEG